MKHRPKRPGAPAASRSCLLSPVSWYSLVLVAFLAVLAPNVSAADPVAWRTGRDLQQLLEKNIGGAGLAWSGQSIREALANLSHAPSYRVAMLLDRRIDPETRLDLALGDVPLAEALARIAAAGGADVCQVGNVVYFGPSSITRRLRTVSELRKQDVRELPPADARRFAAYKPLAWDDLAEPRELLKAIAAEADTTIENLDAVPHDLWAAADLPRISLCDRLTLIAGQYDLTFAIGLGGTTLRLVPIPEKVAIVRSYTVGQGAAEVAEKLTAAFDGCKISVAGTRIEVEGRAEDHLEIVQALAGKPIRKPAAAPTGEVDLDHVRIDKFNAQNQPLGGLIKEVARRLQMEAEFDGPALVAAKVSLDQVVSVELQSGTVRDLLDKVTKPYGLEYEIRDKKLVVRPAAKAE
ncbi:MAG: STN domain-containing protein [Pirellulales bacterium]